MARLKRLTTPKFWRLKKKKSTWAVAVRPGAHKKFESIPIQILLRDVLKIVETGKEANLILQSKQVLVDGKIIKDHAFPVGLMDVLSIPQIKKNFRIVAAKDGLIPIEIPETEAKLKLVKIRNKTILRKGKMQINLTGGRNILTEKKDYSTGDSILIELPENKILEHFKLDKGSVALIIKGPKSGKIVKIEKIKKGEITADLDGKETAVERDYLFVVGKNSPAIKVSD
jgi:small subunit ribosomal protein S4e